MCMIWCHTYDSCGHREPAILDLTCHPKRVKIRDGKERCISFTYNVAITNPGPCPAC